MKQQLKSEAPSVGYLNRLTDDTGIFQHTKFGIPDRSHGYTSDDNARALIAAVMLYSHQEDRHSMELLTTYLSFIHHAQNEDGSFRNFMNYNRSFIETKGSEDCFGRCLWALGFTLSQPSVPDNIHNTCRFMINQALVHIENLTSPRAIAYSLIGLTCMLEQPQVLAYSLPASAHSINHSVDHSIGDSDFLPQTYITSLIERLATRLCTQYQSNRGNGWHWFEDSITYGNAMLPWALFKVSKLFHSAAFREIARESLDFLVTVTFATEGYFKPVGSHGWLERGGQAAMYDEQPIEACEMMLACLEAYEALGMVTYLDRAILCYEWFHGRNSANQSLIDSRTGGCYDGIHAEGLNMNQGSENIVSYLIADRVMKQHI